MEGQVKHPIRATASAAQAVRPQPDFGAGLADPAVARLPQERCRLDLIRHDAHASLVHIGKAIAALRHCAVAGPLVEHRAGQFLGRLVSLTLASIAEVVESQRAAIRRVLILLQKEAALGVLAVAAERIEELPSFDLGISSPPASSRICFSSWHFSGCPGAATLPVERDRLDSVLRHSLAKLHQEAEVGTRRLSALAAFSVGCGCSGAVGLVQAVTPDAEILVAREGAAAGLPVLAGLLVERDCLREIAPDNIVLAGEL